jgi:hypothetical protein
MHVWMSQNNVFMSMHTQRCGGNGYVLDRGCGGNEFIRNEVAEIPGYHLIIRQTAGATIYSQPDHNDFKHCIFEYGKPYGGGTLNGCALISAGAHNTFNDTSFGCGSNDSVNGGDALVQVAPSGLGTYAIVIFRDNRIHANTSGATLIRQESAGQVHMFGNCDMYTQIRVGTPVAGHDGTGWIYNGGTGSRNGRINWGGGVVTRYSGASLPHTMAAQFESPATFIVDSSKDVRMARFMLSSQSWPKVDLDTAGVFQFGNGVGATDVSFGRITTNTIGPGSDDIFQVRGPFDHDGSTLGFYGTTPIAKQTGVAVSAAGIHAALVALGLIAA